MGALVPTRSNTLEDFLAILGEPAGPEEALEEIQEDTEIPYLANPDADPALAPLHAAAACTYRIALGPRAGQKVLTWKDPTLRLASQ